MTVFRWFVLLAVLALVGLVGFNIGYKLYNPSVYPIAQEFEDQVNE